MNISKLKPYVENKYSPSHLNVQAPTFIPKSADFTSTSEEGEDNARQGIELETKLSGQESSTSITVEAETHQLDQGTPQTAAQSETRLETSPIENDWQMVNVEPPIGPTEAKPTRGRINPVRERRPTNFFGITSLGRKSYN